MWIYETDFWFSYKNKKNVFAPINNHTKNPTEIANATYSLMFLVKILMQLVDVIGTIIDPVLSWLIKWGYDGDHDSCII
jgi:hypothetical protein